MKKMEFVDALEEELHRSRVQFLRKDARAFVSRRWMEISADPDVVRWAREFLDEGKGSVTV